MCRTPELATEATLQPVRRFGVDAAILFSDIVVPLEATGVDVEIVDGVGPVIHDPVRDSTGVGRLASLDPESDTPHVLETIRMVTKELEIPLIGFAGAPFTLACYLIEGGPSKDQALTRALMRTDPNAWDALMGRLADNAGAFLRAQVEAGAEAVQLFDSWVGSLSAVDYERFVLPYTGRILAELADLGAPRIHFGLGTAHLLELIAGAGPDVVGIDWRIPIDAARARLGSAVALQGNLDPTVCLAGWDHVEPVALSILEAGEGRGHIFNLGHGVHPDTDPDVLSRLVECVHEWEVPA
jgi:uroporphyrinogen decarboxylase